MRAPKRMRSGRRRHSTQIIAALDTSADSSRERTNSALIVEFLDQALELEQIFLAQSLAVGEMRDQRGHAAAEQSVEQRFALRMYVIFARQQRAIQIAAAVTLGGNRALLQQS